MFSIHAPKRERALYEPGRTELPLAQAALQRRPTGGFTLIELLVVIAVIGILAGLVLSVTGAASVKMKLNRVKAELNQYETAIEAYKAKFGSYPPDHVMPGTSFVNPTVNQLYYELTGTTNTSDGFMSVVDQQAIKPADLTRIFGTPGFVNSSTPDQPAKNFLPSLKVSQTGIIPGTPPVRILTVSVPWPLKYPGLVTPILAAPQLNPVRYNSSKPTNSTVFDLWAEVPIGKRVYLLGNWNSFVPQ